MPSISLIVAIDQQRGIGINNSLPWHLPEDLAHFKRTTSGHAIVMGRKTFESIGRALPNRRNIVVSRNPDWQHANVETAPSLEAACQLVANEDAFIIGGAQIFQQALAFADQLIVTEIQQSFTCDTFFPEIDLALWTEIRREPFQSADSQLRFDIVTYRTTEQ